MKRIVLNFLLVMIAFYGSCQKIIVSNFEQQEASSSIEFVKSLNGEQCALIQLHFKAPNITVEGNVVRLDKSSNAGGYNIWITPGTKMVRIKATDKYPLLIKFKEYGIPELDSGKIYDLSLSVQEHESKNDEVRLEINDPLIKPSLDCHYDFNGSPIVDKNIQDEVDYVLGNMLWNKKDAQQIIEKGYKKGYYRATQVMVRRYIDDRDIEKALIAAQELVDQVTLPHCGDIGDFLLDNGYPELAFKAYQKGALGDETSVCWSKLGYAYENGIGIEKDILLAIQIYQYAARKQYCREEEAIAGLIRLEGNICSKEAIETQRVSVVGKSSWQLKEELENTLKDYRKKDGRDYPKAFIIRKILADDYNDPYAAAELAKAYDGLAYPIQNKELADHYSNMARRLFGEKQRSEVYSSLSSLCGADTIPFNDYSLVRIGDFFYADGSLTHDPCVNLNPIGIVFSLNTSDSEKQNGWSHGWIISLFNSLDRYGARIMNWASGSRYSLNKFCYDVKKAKKDMDGWQTSQEMSKNPNWFLAAEAARSHLWDLPQTTTSGWYLPSLGQINILMENLGGSRMSKNGRFNKTFLTKNCPFFNVRNDMNIWTSSEIAQGKPASLNRGLGEDNYYVSTHNNSYYDVYVPSHLLRVKGCAVYPVAAF